MFPRLIRCGVVALVFALCLIDSAGVKAATAGRSVDLLLAAATEAELQPLLARLEDAKTETRASWTFWTGQLAGRDVVLTRTEGDTLNAVAATTLGIRRYAPRLVVTFGASRPHDPALKAGDLVVSDKFAAFEGLVSDGRPLGGGSDSLTWAKLPHKLATVGEKETPTYSFPADAAALVSALKVSAARGRTVGGTLGSAAQVNREADRVAWIRTQWGTSTEDGESAHIAGCAQLLGVPVIGFRVVEGEPGEAAAAVLRWMEGAR